MKKRLLFIQKACLGLAMVSFASIGQAYSDNIKDAYVEARKAAKAGQTDFAFMHYNAILTTAPESPYKEDALFALGEYFYALSSLDKAESYFKRYLATEGTPNGILFAKAYLLKILELKNDKDNAENLEEDILGSRNHTFVFRSHKDYKFFSPLGKMHKAVFAIDEVSFYTEGELIAKIAY